MYNKSVGIPSEYFYLDLDSKLDLISGLIETDGLIGRKDKSYYLNQTGNEHRNIVYSLKLLCQSCGLRTSTVSRIKDGNEYQLMFHSSQLLQNHIRLRRKKNDEMKEHTMSTPITQILVHKEEQMVELTTEKSGLHLEKEVFI